MEKNLYEILEIDKNASNEVIEKAYKTLVKKYHPDLQDDILKSEYENKLKQINDAYDTLSDPEKRELYNEYLTNLNKQNENLINNLKNENQILKNKLNELSNIYNNSYKNNNLNNSINNNSTYYQNNMYQQQSNYEEELNNAKQQAYHDAYIQDLKARGYKIKYKKTFKQSIKDFIALLLTILILFILWKIPFIHNYITSILIFN